MNNLNSQDGQQEDRSGIPSNNGRISPLCWTIDNASPPKDGGYNASYSQTTDRLGLPLDFGQRFPTSAPQMGNLFHPQTSDPLFGVPPTWAANNDLQPRPFAPDSFIAPTPLLNSDEGGSDELNLFSLFGSPSSQAPSKLDETSQILRGDRLSENSNQRAASSKFQPDSMKITPKIKQLAVPEAKQTEKGVQAHLVQGMFGSKKAKVVLPGGFQPTEYTVILGRGRCNESKGNRRLKALVQSHLQEYTAATGKREKTLIVTKVMNIIQESCPIGAFVKYDNGSWWTAGERASREKVGASFREALHASQKRDSKFQAAQKRTAQGQEWSAAPSGYHQPPYC